MRALALGLGLALAILCLPGPAPSQPLSPDAALDAATRDATRDAVTRDDATRDATRDAVTRDATPDTVTRDATRDAVTRDAVTRDAVTRDATRDAAPPVRRDARAPEPVAAPPPRDAGRVARDVADVLDAASVADADAADVADADVAADAPSLTAPPPAAHRTAPARPARTTGRIARVVLGLLALFALAILAGHPRVRALEKRAGLAMFAASGMPFIALGALARMESVGVLTDAVLRDLAPALEFGLGWIGFRLGIEFDVRVMDRLPLGAMRLLGAESATAFALVSALTAFAFVSLGTHADHTALLRDALVLGACAAVSAPSGARALEAVGWLGAGPARLLRRVAVLDGIVAMAAVAIISAVFRSEQAGSWRLPALGWVLVQIGLGALLGGFTIATVRAARSTAEELALIFGAVAFASGAASYLGLSPLVVGCVAGIVVVNLHAGLGAGRLGDELRALERPIYLTFFAITGALWAAGDPRGWAIMAVWTVGRVLGKLLGTRAALIGEHPPTAPGEPPPGDTPGSTPAPSSLAPGASGATESFPPVAALTTARRPGLALVPTSAVSIAVILGAEVQYQGSMAPFLETAVIAGALVTELAFHVALRVSAPRALDARPDGERGAGEGRAEE